LDDRTAIVPRCRTLRDNLGLFLNAGKLVDLCASLRQTERCILDADQGKKTDVAIAIAVREPKAVVREADVVGNSISKGARLRGQFIVRTVAARMHGLGRNVLAPESRNDDVTTEAKTMY
jgi:hypothetical protein